MQIVISTHHNESSPITSSVPASGQPRAAEARSSAMLIPKDANCLSAAATLQTSFVGSSNSTTTTTSDNGHLSSLTPDTPTTPVSQGSCSFGDASGGHSVLTPVFSHITFSPDYSESEDYFKQRYVNIHSSSSFASEEQFLMQHSSCSDQEDAAARRSTSKSRKRRFSDVMDDSDNESDVELLV